MVSNWIINNLASIFDIDQIIRYGGLLSICLVVFGTTGLFFCFFIPVGAFLFTGGIFIATGDLPYNFFIVTLLLILSSVLGNITGYWFGMKTGPLLYRRPDSRFYKKQYLITAKTFYEKHGWLALTLGLYLPIIRTFSSIVAGVIRLDFKRFIGLVTAGSVVWITSFVAAGYFIGSRPFLKPWLKYIVIAFILMVTIPLVLWTRRELKRMKIKSQK